MGRIIQWAFCTQSWNPWIPAISCILPCIGLPTPQNCSQMWQKVADTDWKLFPVMPKSCSDVCRAQCSGQQTWCDLRRAKRNCQFCYHNPSPTLCSSFRILVSAGGLEPIPHRYWGNIVHSWFLWTYYSLLEKEKWVCFFLPFSHFCQYVFTAFLAHFLFPWGDSILKFHEASHSERSSTCYTLFDKAL